MFLHISAGLWSSFLNQTYHNYFVKVAEPIHFFIDAVLRPWYGARGLGTWEHKEEIVSVPAIKGFRVLW